MATRKFVIAWCNKKVKDMKSLVINDLSKDIEKRAKRNFLRASQEIPACDNYIDVWSSVGLDKFQISCGGTQVLFAEFGAGHTFYHKTPMTTDAYNVEVEKAPRPVGIVGIGEYGKHYGKQSKWYFSDVNLIPETGKNHTTMVKATKTGNLIYITEGIRPTRALYNAVNSGVKNLTRKRTRRIG